MDVDHDRNDSKTKKPAHRLETQGEEARAVDAATESDHQSTPEPLEDETASEDEEEAAPPDKQTHEHENTLSSPPTESRITGPKRTTRGSSKTPVSAPPRKTESPPPRRELPFTRRKGAIKSSSTPGLSEKQGNERINDTDDDEL